MSIIFFFALFGVSITAAAEQFIEATAGTTVTLPCQTGQTSSYIVWNHFPVGAILSNIVYLSGEIYDNYRGRFAVPDSRIGVYNLVISRVVLEDSGKYTCTIGNQLISLELIVLEFYPSPQYCASNSSGNATIGTNSCGIEPETVSLNCTLRFQGNLLPVLNWESNPDVPVNSTVEAIDSKTTVSTVILKANEQKGATYRCFVKYFNASLVSRFSCSLDVNVITFSSQTRELSPNCGTTKSVSCSVDATATDCSYTWTNNKSKQISSDSTLFLQSLQEGQYTCKADCVFNTKHRCVFEPVKVNNTCGVGTNQAIGTGGIVGIVIGVAVVITITIASIILLLYRKLWMKKLYRPEVVAISGTQHPDGDSRENDRLQDETERRPENT